MSMGASPDTEVDGLDGFTHRYADVNDTRIHYVVGGKGPIVVLLHGFPYTWAVWRNIMPAMAAAGYTVLVPDLRGMGQSAPAEDHTFSKENVAEDVRAIVQSIDPSQPGRHGYRHHGGLRLCFPTSGGGGSACAFGKSHPGLWA